MRTYDPPRHNSASNVSGTRQAQRYTTTDRRVLRPCETCSLLRIRCAPLPEQVPCARCQLLKLHCVYPRDGRRAATAYTPQSTPSFPGSVSILQEATRPSEPRQEQQGKDWHAPSIASQAMIVDLVELYFELVYPIFPLFHERSYTRIIARGDHLKRQALFASTMAVCALASNCVCDGALVSPRWDRPSLKTIDRAVFGNEAKKQLMALHPISGFEVLRGYAIMAVLALQTGSLDDFHKHLDFCYAIVSRSTLHEESSWPLDIGIIEREERRRVLWSIYTIGIHSAAVWGSEIRLSEGSCKVAYPCCDDDRIDDIVASDSYFESANASSLWSTEHAFSWLPGWNFNVDVYRALESALAKVEDGSLAPAQHVFQKHHNLPRYLKVTPVLTAHSKLSRLGHQVVMIRRGMQLLRMELCIGRRAGTAERCQLVNNAVYELGSVPAPYLVAVSALVVHHSRILGAFLNAGPDQPLSRVQFAEVGSVMARLAKLLQRLQATRSASREEAYYPKTFVDDTDSPSLWTATEPQASARIQDFATQLRLLNEQDQRLQLTVIPSEPASEAEKALGHRFSR